MSRRNRGESGIRLFEVEKKNRSDGAPENGPVLILVQGAIICLLAVSWWRTFFDVFPAGISEAWLYGFLFPLAVLGVRWTTLKGWKKSLAALFFIMPAALLLWRRQSLAAAAVNYLANAYLRVHEAGTEPLLYNEPALQAWIPGLLTALETVPLLLIWSRVLVKNRGKILAVLLMLLPAALAAVEGFFPSAGACWLLIFSAGIYFAVCGGSSGKAAIAGAASASVCIMVLFLASNAIVKPVETLKTADNGIYRKTRTAVREGIVSKLTDFTGNSIKKNVEEEEPAKDPEEKDEEGIPGEEESDPDMNIADQDEAQVQEPANQPAVEGSGGFLEGGPGDLKAIASFSPGDGRGIVIKTKERPRETYYYPEGYGSVYDGHSWRMESLTDDVLPDYSQYPSELRRLVKLCRAQDIESLEDAARFIESEFKENTVYDYTPGSTPADQDFAEYFLFENKKGFCVHFATTATLMYRILGYQARYAEGYAVPASAFKEQKDGTYAAEVTGQMGHAWCETYADGWQVREHTLPYTGEDIRVVPPASDSRQNAPARAKAGSGFLMGALTILGMLLLLAFLFLIQAAVRRKQRMMQCRRYRQGRGILVLYQTLYETAVFLGMEKAEDPLNTETFENLGNYISELSAGDLQWIQDVVWRSMFAQSPPVKEEHERLYRIVIETTKKVRHSLAGWKKIKYHQINCLG